jgi:serine/threonine protein kinase
VTNPQQSPNAANRFAQDCPIVGIWRVGQAIHRSEWATLSLAQPADAIDSPRWDYVIKMASGSETESVRQIDGFVAAATNVMHPNLVAVLDSSSHSQMPYLVMPKLDGESMGHHLTSSPAKKLPVALWLIRQTAQALSVLHESGWIHGDVKPENVMVGPRGHATLVDLGFATRIHSVRNRLFRGTPDYASPELMSGQHAALPAMDIFSLGRMLWQWMARIEPVSQVVLEPVADLVETMIAEDPNDRPAANEVVKELLQLEIETLGRHIGPGETQQQRRAA